MTLFENTKAFSGFAVPDLDAAESFYGETLGVRVSRDEMGFVVLHLAGERDTIAYIKPDHEPATYTILNFPTDDIEGTVDALVERGVTFLRYPDAGQDERGIMRDNGPNIAWFTDPAGNILSVIEA